MKHFIYHKVSPIGRKAQRFIMYELVATIEAKSINDAFVKAQNDFNALYRVYDVRSTCVDDLIQSEADKMLGVYYKVLGMGFEVIKAN